MLLLAHFDYQTYQDVTFFRRGYLKSKICAQKPRDFEKLKNRTPEEIANIPLKVINRVLENARGRLEKCLRKDDRLKYFL